MSWPYFKQKRSMYPKNSKASTITTQTPKAPRTFIFGQHMLLELVDLTHQLSLAEETFIIYAFYFVTFHRSMTDTVRRASTLHYQLNAKKKRNDYEC